MGMGIKRTQSVGIIARMVKEDPTVTAEAIIAAHVAEMYPGNPTLATACYKLSLKEAPELTAGAPALVSKRGRPAEAKKEETPSAAEAPTAEDAASTELSADEAAALLKEEVEAIDESKAALTAA